MQLCPLDRLRRLGPGSSAGTTYRVPGVSLSPDNAPALNQPPGEWTAAEAALLAR